MNLTPQSRPRRQTTVQSESIFSIGATNRKLSGMCPDPTMRIRAPVCDLSRNRTIMFVVGGFGDAGAVCYPAPAPSSFNRTHLQSLVSKNAC